MRAEQKKAEKQQLHWFIQQFMSSRHIPDHLLLEQLDGFVHPG
jgi:hypothetical protein